MLPLCLLLGYAVHRHRRGELFRDSTDNSAVLRKEEEIRAIELMATVQCMESGGGACEVSGEVVAAQERPLEAAVVSSASADSSAAAGVDEGTTVNALHA